jgi:hypothetical protein
MAESSGCRLTEVVQPQRDLEIVDLRDKARRDVRRALCLHRPAQADRIRVPRRAREVLERDVGGALLARLPRGTELPRPAPVLLYLAIASEDRLLATRVGDRQQAERARAVLVPFLADARPPVAPRSASAKRRARTCPPLEDVYLAAPSSTSQFLSPRAPCTLRNHCVSTAPSSRSSDASGVRSATSAFHTSRMSASTLQPRSFVCACSHQTADSRPAHPTAVST